MTMTGCAWTMDGISYDLSVICSVTVMSDDDNVLVPAHIIISNRQNMSYIISFERSLNVLYNKYSLLQENIDIVL